jgi:tRNA 2-thiouridine synthesizing protein A
VSSADAPPARLDLKGLACPLPALKTRRALARLVPGDRLVVEATDPMAAVDIPHLCAQDGHRLVTSERDGRVLRFTIEKGGTDGAGG